MSSSPAPGALDGTEGDSKSVDDIQSNLGHETESAIKIGGIQGHVEETIDGALVVLWEAPFCDWRPIRNCTGRYTLREKKSSPQMTTTTKNIEKYGVMRPSTLTPQVLMQYAAAAAAAATETPIYASNDNYDCAQKEAQTAPFKVYEFPPPSGRRDRVWVLPLDSAQTTGIITYIKEENNNNQRQDTSASDNSGFDESDPVSLRYVHTLNAPSGFQRKLKAIGITLIK